MSKKILSASPIRMRFYVPLIHLGIERPNLSFADIKKEFSTYLHQTFTELIDKEIYRN